MRSVIRVSKIKVEYNRNRKKERGEALSYPRLSVPGNGLYLTRALPLLVPVYLYSSFRNASNTYDDKRPIYLFQDFCSGKTRCDKHTERRSLPHAERLQ
jgi:hypothetical protein